jgi:hypothetical protein
MAAKDLYHDHVRTALEKDGWAITHEHLKLDWDDSPIYVDLAAERLLTAEKGSRKIAVEVKSFVSPSRLKDIYAAVGQFMVYHQALLESDPDRELFLAVTEPTFLRTFALPKGERLLRQAQIKLIVFKAKTKEIVQWIT